MMANVYLITGNDIDGIEKRAKTIVRECTDENNDAFGLEVYKESDERGPSQVVEDALISLFTPPFLGERKTVWLQNISFPEAIGSPSRSEASPRLAGPLSKLVDFISSSFPNDISLVISGPGVGSTSPLYKSCAKAGKVISCTKPDLNSSSWRGDIRRIILNKTRQLEMTLSNEAIEYLIEVVGVDTSRLTNEIEKVYCYAGKNPLLDQVQELCVGNRDAVFYALSNAIGVRCLKTALETVKQLLAHSKEPESLVIGQIRYLGKYINELIQTKLLMSYYKISSGRQLGAALAKMNEIDKERFKENIILSKSSWRIGVLGTQAERYTGPELVSALSLVAHADKHLVSSGLSNRFILETLLVRIIANNRQAKIL